MHRRDETARDPDRRLEMTRRREERWWAGLGARAAGGEGWTAPGADDSTWKTMPLPAAMSAVGLGGFDGLVFFRRRIELPPDWPAEGAAVLELGPIDDCDDVWINGTHVGATHRPGRWAAPRRYAVPAGVLRGGGNLVAVRVLDTGGAGGINSRAGQMALRAEGGRRLALAGTWRYRRGPAAGDLPRRPQGPAIRLRFDHAGGGSCSALRRGDSS